MWVRRGGLYLEEPEDYRGMKSILSKSEMGIITGLAEVRVKTNVKNGVRERKLSDYDALEIHKEGGYGEFAFAKILNAYPDFSTHSRSDATGNHGYDLTYMGITIDVKTTRHHHGRLLCPPWKGKPADVYVLMTGYRGTYFCRGFTTGPELFQPERYREIERGNWSYEMFQCELRGRF